MSGELSAAASRLADAMGRADELPKGARRNKAIRSQLVRLHRDVMRAAAGVGDAAPGELDELAASVQRLVPVGSENALTIRERVFVRLLRAGAVEPAWTLAEDDSSGVVRSTRVGMKWAGGPETNVVLPLPTVVDGDAVFAWLPGFRDPRWGLPDSVYDVTDRVRLQVVLEQLSLESDQLKLAGSAHFTVLAAHADGEVTAVLRGPGGEDHRVRATRARTAKGVAPSGPELTRLAWAGWYVAIDVTALRSAPGQWSLWLELAQDGLRDEVSLGLHRGSYAEGVRSCGPIEARGRVFRLRSGQDGRLLLSVTRLGRSARVVPRPLRAVVRQMVPRP